MARLVHRKDRLPSSVRGTLPEDEAFVVLEYLTAACVVRKLGLPGLRFHPRYVHKMRR